MAEFSFEEASTPTLNKPTSFSFEDAIDSGGNKSTTPTVEGKSGAAFGMYPKPKMGPGTDATGLSAFASSAIEGALATPGVLLGARAGSAIMPRVAPFVGLWSKPIGGIAGGIGGGILANLGISSLEKFADSVFGTNIAQVREEEQQQYPYTSLFGQVAGGSLNPWMRPSIPSTFKQAAFGGGVMGVVGAGQRAVTGGDTFDPIAVGADVVSGAFTTPTKRGLRLLGHTPVINNNKPFDIPETPPGTATPEEKTAYIDKLKAIKAERDAKAALVEAEEPAPPPVEEGLKTREEHKTANNNLEEDIYLKLEIDRQVAENTGDVEGLKLVEEQIKINQDKLQQLRKDIPAVEFKNPEQPTWEELHDHLWNSRSVGEAFDTLLSGPRIGGKGQRLLIRALNQSEFIRSAPLNFSKDYIKYIDKNGVEQDAAGLYKADENIHSVELGKDGDLAALLHESIHAGTYRLLEEGNSPAALKLKELHQEFLDRHNAEYDAALEKFQQENIAPTIGELSAFEKANRKQYGLENVQEFIAEAFTSAKFQKLLASIKSKEPGGNVIGNMWSAFKNVVREGLNVPASERTAFDDAIEHGVKLIEESSGFKVEGDTTTTIPSKASDKFAQEEEKTFWNKVQEVRTNKLAAEQEAQKTYEVYQKTPTALTHHLYKKAEKDLRTAATAYYEYIPMEERLPSDFNDEVAVKQYQDSVNKRLEFLEREQAFKQSQTALDKTSNKTLPSKIKESISEPAAEAAEKIDPRSIPNEEAFYKHATNIYETYGEAAAIKFLEDYNTNLKERSIPIPETLDQFGDSLHKFRTFESKDKSENVVNFRENVKNGVTEEERAKWFDMRERGEELPPEGKAILDGIDSENVALIRKIKALGGDVGDEFATGQSRTRVFGDVDSNWKDAIKKLFANEGGFSNNIAEQANAARDRTVFGTNDGRIIELHRQPEDVVIPGKKTIKKGTEIFEWKDDKRKLIGRSDNLELKRGDTFELSKLGDALTDGVGGTSVRRTGKFELTIVDAKVPDIEASAPYRYLHDAEVSARLANIGLRKMARELEFIQNLKQSKLFETIGFSPDKPLKDLPKGWIVPSNIDRVPELRGWHFDPKAAAIISDFAKVWDNTLWMKLTNQLVKNMMLNPVPHMFNEVMHLWNARGFSGWVDPRKLGSFAITARQAWRDVGNQTKFYRDIMREGGSILGADPRNDLFDKIIMDAGKNILKDPELSRSVSLLAKKLGTSVLDLYNGVSKASTKAMWFTRDVMYVQYIREIMNRHEKRTGNRMELSDAIVEAERHMPNYRMPSEVLGSRGVAWTLKNPNLSMFSRYHYGMVKSLINTLKDVNPKNLTSPEGRVHFREGIDSMLAIGVATAVVYPLMDEMAQALFGEGAEQRRAGPYHLLHAAEQVIGGKKDATALIWPVFTFNPVLLSLGQIVFNANIFNKKQLYHPDDSIDNILGDLGIYTVKQIPQVPPVMSAVSEEGGETQFIAKQLDIKAKTEKQLEQEEKAKAYQARSKKNRDTKREKSTYKP